MMRSRTTLSDWRRKMEDYYKNFALVPIPETFSRFPEISEIGGIDKYLKIIEREKYVDWHDVTFELLRALGFMSVQCNCVFKGDVQALIEKLREIGWKNPNLIDHNNPFLLVHENSDYCFNYAHDEKTPDSEYISFFRGKFF